MARTKTVWMPAMAGIPSSEQVFRAGTLLERDGSQPGLIEELHRRGLLLEPVAD